VITNIIYFCEMGAEVLLNLLIKRKIIQLINRKQGKNRMQLLQPLLFFCFGFPLVVFSVKMQAISLPDPAASKHISELGANAPPSLAFPPQSLGFDGLQTHH
jgi:uncharacterized membrane protein YoaT (DUF817 family)